MTAADPRPRHVVLVVAMARDNVIGARGGMPWHLPEDLRHFKRLTLGHPMIMGRRTFDAIGRPLPGRRSIVVTRDADWTADGVDVARDLGEALALAAATPEARADGVVTIVGGGQIYAQALDVATRLEVTHIDASPEGDTFFPAIDPDVWVETARDDRDGFSFVTYDRR